MIRPWLLVWLFLLFACDGPMRPAVDAGSDADGSDTQGDVEDVVDAGVDAMDIPVCIPWRPETGVPPEAITDVPDLSMGREVWEGNIPSPGIISGSQMALMFEPYQHMVEIWLVDLTTMDATRITEESVQSYPPLSIRDGRIDAVQCPGDTFEECGLFTYSLEENNWRPMFMNTSNATHKMSSTYPSVGTGYTLFSYRTMEIDTEWSLYDLRLIHHDTLEVELLVDWENLDRKGGLYAAGGRYSAWCAANTAYDAWVLWLYDSATGERTELDTRHLGQC